MKKLHVASTPLEDTANKIAKLMIDEEPYRWVYSDRAEVELIKGIRKLLNPLIPDAQEQTEIINKIRIEYFKVFHGNKTRAERENPEVIPHNQIADIVRRILQKGEFGTGYLERIRYQNFPEQKKAWISRIEEFINRCFNIFSVYQFIPGVAPEEKTALSPEDKLEKIIDGFHAVQMGESVILERYPQYEDMWFYQQFRQEARDLLRDIMIYHGMSGENFKTYFSGQPVGAAFVEILSFYMEIKNAKDENDFPGGLQRYSSKRIKKFFHFGAVMRKLRIASEIKAPEQGVIHGEGFISPKGEIFDLTGDEDNDKPSLRHGDWIVNNKDWLESKGYSIKFPAGLNIDSPGIMSGEVNDMLRDQLVKQGWIHIFTPDIISVWKFNARVEKKIRDLIRSYDYLIDSTEEITVHEQSIDAVYKIDLQESEDA